MSQSNPNPEERNRIVNAALKTLSPGFKPEQEDDLKKLFQRFDNCCNVAMSQMDPITEAATTTGKIHTVPGRREWETTCLKLILDQMVQAQLDFDEVRFLLAYTHARRLVQQVA